MKSASLREPDPREEVDGAKEEDDQTRENKTKVEVIVARHLIYSEIYYPIIPFDFSVQNIWKCYYTDRMALCGLFSVRCKTWRVHLNSALHARIEPAQTWQAG